MTAKSEKTTTPNIIILAESLESLVNSRSSFTQDEAAALNSLKTAIFVNLTQKNLGEVGITRSGR